MKIIKILFLLLSIGYNGFTQTKITATLVRNNIADNYPVTYDSLQSGGMHVYSSISARDSMPLELRKIGMFATVLTQIYQLTSGLTNNDWKLFKTKLTILDFPVYENNKDALKNNLVEGDQYRLPYNNGSNQISIVTTSTPAEPFTLIQNCLLPNSQVVITWYPKDASSLRVDWGDGTVDIFGHPRRGYFIVPSHNYLDPGEYIISIIPDDPSLTDYFDISTAISGTNNITAIYNLTTLSGLRTFKLSGNKITKFSYKIPEDFLTLNLSNNIIDNLDLTFPSNTQVAIDIQGNKLSSDNINLILSRLLVITGSGMIYTMNNQSPLAPPTGQGIIDKQTLIDRGQQVITD